MLFIFIFFIPGQLMLSNRMHYGAQSQQRQDRQRQQSEWDPPDRSIHGCGIHRGPNQRSERDIRSQSQY